MIVDTSAWVEYLRATGSPTHRALREAVASDASIASPAPVVMELLAGCRTEEAAARLERMVSRFEILEVEGLADFEDAAYIQRACRRGGDTVRSMIDCLIAAVALREGRPLLTTDRDFEVIARHVGLELAAVSSRPSPWDVSSRRGDPGWRRERWACSARRRGTATPVYRYRRSG